MKNFIQILWCCIFFFICCNINAASNPKLNLISTSLSWTKQAGESGGSTNGNGVSTDNAGNIYVTGSTDVGIFGQIQHGKFDYLITKYDQSGSVIWSKQVGAIGGSTLGYGISVDNSGNIYVTGYTNVGISGQSQNGSMDYFIAKYDPKGNLIWSSQVGALGGQTTGEGISIDNFGNVYIVGDTTVGLAGQKQNGISDYFIAKYDSSGNLTWIRQVGANRGYTHGKGVSVDKSGNIYMTGWTSVGLSGQQQNGGYDYFIAKYDTNANLIWAKQVGASLGFTYGQGISADTIGNVYITGYTNKGISNQQQNGIYDYFIAKYDANSNLIWTVQNGNSGGNTYGVGISAYNSGSIYITGNTNVGLSGQKQNGSKDYFIAEYNQYGGLVWYTQVGASGGWTAGLGINTDIYGNFYIIGNTSIGISGQKQNGINDYFIAKYIN